MSEAQADVAIVGGTGLDRLEGLYAVDERLADTPYGAASGPLCLGQLEGRKVLFLARHGVNHHIPPHRINYQANLWALHHAGVRKVIAVAAVGGIAPEVAPGAVAVPDQLIDYTWGRAHTFSDGADTPLQHVEFAGPYDTSLRQQLLDAAMRVEVPLVDGGVYGCTQGPRLETIAEVRRMQADGCTMVGMTGMPEAALARELDMAYACLAVSVNWAAGQGGAPQTAIHAQIKQSMDIGMAKVHRILCSVLPQLV